MNKENYQTALENIIDNLPKDSVPTLMLHSCCAPCSSYCLEYLSKYFEITVFYYNPNISFEEEYRKRVSEQIRLINTYNDEKKGYHIKVIVGDYEPSVFYETAKGYEKCHEGGERCERCFRLRIGKTAQLAKENNFDYFATTLTISPLKNARLINEIGFELSGEYDIKWLPSDFKKKDGYKRSIELSNEYGLYRQNFCGCVYSKAEQEKKENS